MKTVICPHCAGAGVVEVARHRHADAHAVETCSHCNRSGVVTVAQAQACTREAARLDHLVRYRHKGCTCATCTAANEFDKRAEANRELFGLTDGGPPW